MHSSSLYFYSRLYFFLLYGKREFRSLLAFMADMWSAKLIFCLDNGAWQKVRFICNKIISTMVHYLSLEVNGLLYLSGWWPLTRGWVNSFGLIFTDSWCLFHLFIQSLDGHWTVRERSLRTFTSESIFETGVTISPHIWPSVIMWLVPYLSYDDNWACYSSKN